MGGGKSGGGGTIPHQNELGDLLTGNLMSMSLQRNPAMAKAFGGGSDLGKGFDKMFGGSSPGSMVGQNISTPFYQRALSGMGGAYRPTYANLASPTAGAPMATPSGSGGAASGKSGGSGASNPTIKNTGMLKGAGALSPVPGATVPTGAPSKALTLPPGGMPPGGSAPNYNAGAPSGGAMQFQQPTTERIQALTVPQQQYNLLGQVGTEQINRSGQLAQQDLMRQMASRGLGQSGLAIKGAADLYNRGAGQQVSDFARNLAAQRMGAEFTEAQGARSLEAQRQQNMAGLNLDTQTRQEQANQAARTAALNEQLGFGKLGLDEQGQQLSAQNALLQSLTGLGQSNIASYANQAGGKGK